MERETKTDTPQLLLENMHPQAHTLCNNSNPRDCQQLTFLARHCDRRFRFLFRFCFLRFFPRCGVTETRMRVHWDFDLVNCVHILLGNRDFHSIWY